MTLTFEPSNLHLLVAAATGLFGAWFLYRSGSLPREVRILRSLTLTLLLFFLLKPTILHHREETRRPALPVLVDVSDSMRVQDSPDRPTRLETAKRWILENDSQLRRRVDPVYLAFAETPRLVQGKELETLKPAATSKNVQAALEEAFGLGKPREAWILSDGVGDRSPSLEIALERMGMKVSPLGVGDPRRRRGLSVQHLSKPDYAFQHLSFDLRADWEAVELAGKTVELTLRRLPRDGEGAAVVATRRIQIEDDYEVLATTLTVRPKILGSNQYRLELRSGRDSEIREFALDVLRQKWRIMYLAGRPSHEYGALRAFLKSNPNYELVSFVILRERQDVVTFPDREMALIPFPAREIFTRDIDNFDLFILENFAYWKFNLPKSYLESIKNFVRRGGGFLMIGGDSAFANGGYRGTSLEEILPVTLSGAGKDYQEGTFRPLLTEKDHPMLRGIDPRVETLRLWASLPPLSGSHDFLSLKPGARALVVHPEKRDSTGKPMPVFALNEVGLGKVLVMSSPSTWKWGLAGGRSFDLSGFYSGFWSRAIQYLTGSLELEKVRFAKLPRTLSAVPPVEIELFVFDEDFRPLSGRSVEVNVQWTGPRGKSRSLPALDAGNGTYRIELEDLKPGLQKLDALVRVGGRVWGKDQVKFRWEDASAKPRPLDRSFLTRLAQVSGGRYDDLKRPNLEDRLERLPKPKVLREVSSRSSLWDRPLGLAILLLLLLSEWLLRRRRGFL